MRKKILSMSIAAVMTAITSSGVMAFDTDGSPTAANDGPILVQNEPTMAAGYQGNNLPAINGTAANTVNPHPPVQSLNILRVNDNGLGDALIFPMFKQGEGWGTEIVVRNTNQERAIVAKVAIYASEDSEEMLDFNVYLSAADVVRFKIENGKVTSEDGSILRVSPMPSSGSDYVTRDKFASKSSPFTRDFNTEKGYVVVYGMAQASTDQDPSDNQDMSYHKQHHILFKNYRRELDACRPGWRNGHQNAMVNGTYIRHTLASTNVDNYSVAAPNQRTNCNNTGPGTPGNFFGDVGASLTGTVRLYNAINGARDMVLPATAINNFTDGNKIIYTEGEIASLQDRRIIDGGNGWAKYSEQGIRADARAFLVNSASYNFAADSLANKLTITQPYKRVLVQLGNDDGYWQDTDTNFGGFSYLYNVFDEDEHIDNNPYTNSPYSSLRDLLRNELETSLKNLEEVTTL